MNFSDADSSYLQEPIAAGILKEDTAVKALTCSVTEIDSYIQIIYKVPIHHAMTVDKSAF